MFANRFLWLHCLVGVRRELAAEDDVSSMLLDRRLARVRGRHVVSFTSGTVALFLRAEVALSE
jgi:hypothetical protein